MEATFTTTYYSSELSSSSDDEDSFDARGLGLTGAASFFMTGLRSSSEDESSSSLLEEGLALRLFCSRGFFCATFVGGFAGDVFFAGYGFTSSDVSLSYSSSLLEETTGGFLTYGFGFALLCKSCKGLLALGGVAATKLERLTIIAFFSLRKLLNILIKSK